MPDDPGPSKLLLVVHSINARGGMEVQLAHLANGLAAEEYHVCVMSIASDDDPEARRLGPSLDPAVRVVHLGAGDRWDKLRKLPRMIALARAHDLVHCTGWDASLWGRLAAVVARRPAVVAEHTPGREHQSSSSGADRTRLIGWHNRLLDPLTERTVICANYHRDLLSAEGVAEDKMVLIPNGVPVDELRRRGAEGLTREELGIPPEALVIAHVARFAPQKRQSLTLETAARLREELGDVRVVFAGHGPDLEAVQERARRSGADWAVFLGRHGNVPSVFALADLAVLPSTGEAMPMAVIESIAVGTPVVACDVGDVGAVLDATGAGLHVPADDVEAFHDRCRDVLADEILRARLQAAARDAVERIDAAAMVRSYDELLRSILARLDGVAA